MARLDRRIEKQGIRTLPAALSSSAGASGAHIMAKKLPDDPWPLLSEALALTMEISCANEDEAKKALERAFRNGRVATRGRCESYRRDDGQTDIDDFTWDRAEIDWSERSFRIPDDRGGVHRFTDVEVERSGLERWLKGTEPETPAPSAPATPSPRASDDTRRDNTLLRIIALLAMKAYGVDPEDPDEGISSIVQEFKDLQTGAYKLKVSETTLRAKIREAIDLFDREKS